MNVVILVEGLGGELELDTAYGSRATWAQSVAAATLGVVLLLLSQMASESLSRAGPYAPEREIALLLPVSSPDGELQFKRVTPVFTDVPAYVFNDPDRTDYGVFETTFEWNEGEPPPALLMAYFRRLDAVELNGNPVALQNLRHQSLVGAWRPTTVLFEQSHLIDGTNVLRITDPGKSRKVLPAFKITSAEEAERAAFSGAFFELHLPLAVTGVMLFVAAFCAAINWPQAQRLEIISFVALLLVWSLRNAMGLDLLGDLPSPWRVFVAYWIGFVLSAAFAAYCFAWSGKGKRWFVAAWLIALLSIILTLAIGYESGGAAFEISYLVESWLVPLLVLAGVFVAVLGEVRSGAARYIQLLLIVGAGSALALDALDERFDLLLGLTDPQPMIYYATPRHGILLALGVLGAMIFHQVRARKLSDDLNGELNRQLDQRKAEIAEAHEREKLWVREQAHSEERQRIMRDMHDGLGSQLMGMLLAARRGKAEPDKVAAGLQQVVDELRLMIDSMDSVGESLASALAGFRNRLQPRVEDAGFRFEWIDRLDNEFPSYPPRKTLQLFRIVQEAVTNTLKHSGGSRIRIVLEHDPTRVGWLRVRVEDDGSGIGEPRLGGHGLDNMAARAKQVGGALTFGSVEDGLGGLVLIEFPPSEPAERLP